MPYLTKKIVENTKIQEEAKAAIKELESSNIFRYATGDRSMIPVLAAYLLYRVQLLENPSTITYEEIMENYRLNIDEEVLPAIRQYITEQIWGEIKPLVEKYSSEAMALVAFAYDLDSRGREYSTPTSIVKLAARILDIQPGERVADLCCGTGAFINYVNLEVPEATYTGYEINSYYRAISKIRSELISHETEIILQDVFSINLETTPKYDKIFANYPFGLRFNNLSGGNKLMEELASKCLRHRRVHSSDWAFNYLIHNLLAEKGKAVAIMTNGSTWNTMDEPVRKYFVEQGIIEAVITLPKNMFSYMSVSTTMIVISSNNKDIRFVDATNICQQGRRMNEFSDEDIDTIMTALTEDTDFSRKITLNQLKENEYTLSLSRYLDSNIEIEYPETFETVIKKITRGAPCNAKQLDDMASEEPTNMQYLMISNIQDGIIDKNLKYLSYIDPKFEKYCLNNNDLILSKNGYPYKVAVASVNKGQKILANGNLFIIEVDAERVDPYYLKAFFESEKGIATLKSITVGATIPNIGIDKLSKIKVPVPPMEEQRRVVNKYLETLDEIEVLKLRMEKATSRLRHIFDEEGGE